MEQLFIYDALFCMEYHVKPKDILIENRIYQNDDVLIETDVYKRQGVRWTVWKMHSCFWTI